jgi:uncharacterized membrane protein
VFVAVAFFPLVVSIGFLIAGAWLVLPFAGFELLALGLAFYLVHCHSEDYESITITGNNLAVEWREYKTTSRMVFQCYWARVILRDAPGGEQRLWLRSHGKEVEFGRYMNNEARLILAGQLKRRTGLVY